MVRRRRQQRPGAKAPPLGRDSSSSSSSSSPEENDSESYSTTSSTIRRRRQRRVAGMKPPPRASEVLPSSSAAAEEVEVEEEKKEEGETVLETVTSVEEPGSATEEVVPWGDKAPAKIHLRSLLEDETSWVRVEWNKGENQEPKESQASRIERIRNRSPLFKQYTKTLFYNNFRSLKTTIDDEKIAVAFDKKAFIDEKEKWPINGTLANGKPRWQETDVCLSVLKNRPSVFEKQTFQNKNLNLNVLSSIPESTF